MNQSKQLKQLKVALAALHKNKHNVTVSCEYGLKMSNINDPNNHSIL